MAKTEFPTGLISEVDGHLAIVRAEGADIEARARKVEGEIGPDMTEFLGEVHGGGRRLLLWILGCCAIGLGVLIWATR